MFSGLRSAFIVTRRVGSCINSNMTMSMSITTNGAHAGTGSPVSKPQNVNGAFSAMTTTKRFSSSVAQDLAGLKGRHFLSIDELRYVPSAWVIALRLASFIDTRCMTMVLSITLTHKILHFTHLPLQQRRIEESPRTLSRLQTNLWQGLESKSRHSPQTFDWRLPRHDFPKAKHPHSRVDRNWHVLARWSRSLFGPPRHSTRCQ